MNAILIGTCLAGALVLLINLSVPASAQTQPSSSNSPDKTSAKASVEELAKLKQNPVSGLRQLLIDVVVSPDSGGSGETEGVYSLQLAWPFSLSTDWKLITCTILSLAHLPGASGGDSVVGLSNTLINLFVAPKKPGAIIWGFGPAILLPTRTGPALGSDHPALVLFYEKNEWSAGVVASTLIDYLLDEEYKNIIAVDISETALRKLRKRLGEDKSRRVRWITDDITKPVHLY